MSSEPTDWDSLYLRIKLSPLGADFTAEKFLRTPVGLIQWVIEQIDTYNKAQLNAASVSVAHLNNQVMWAMYGFGGGKGPKPKATVMDFLPFPELGQDLKATPGRGSSGPSEGTRAVLKRCLGAGQLPYDIFLALWQKAA